MVADRVIANLLRIAREDLEGAKTLAAVGNRNAAYLCEQAAEKSSALCSRYPTPAGRIPDAPQGDELALFIQRVDAALHEVAGLYGVDVSK